MFHNESVNIWTHIIGIMIYVYIINNNHWRYEPSSFYYNSVQKNENISVDIGVPKQNHYSENPLSNLTSEFFVEYLN